MRLSAEKSRLDRSLGSIEEELQAAQQQVVLLQVGGRRPACSEHGTVHVTILQTLMFTFEV